MASSKKKSSIEFDFRDLEIFCKVVELGSHTRAAEAVSLSQASVSERMARLEREIGTPLFERRGRRSAPTRAGKLLHDRALRHLELRRETCLELQEFLGVKGGEIDIGGSTIPGEYLLPGVIERFRRSYPGITVRLSIGDSEEISRRVSEGTLELGVVGSRGKARGLVHRELWRDELVLVVPGSHRWSRRRAVTIEEVIAEPFILREAGSGTQSAFFGQLRRRGAGDPGALTVAARLGSSTAVKEGVKAGLGVSILSARAVELELETGILKRVRIRGFRPTRRFYLVRDGERRLSPPGQAFMDFVARQAVPA